jgi:hypothetical protein
LLEDDFGMQERKEVADYLSIVKQRLQADGFNIIEDITYRNQPLRCVAKRSRLQPEFNGFAEFFFIFAEFSTLDETSLREFSSKCFRYAKRYRSNPLPCGLFENVICFPVALCGTTNKHLVKAIRNDNPPMHWSAIEFPVIYDLRTQQLYYFEETPLWGKLYWGYFRAMTIAMLSP